jgi:N-acetylneuraminic acid mutarotase
VKKSASALVLLLIICSLMVTLPNVEIVTAAEDSWTTMEPMLTARAGIGVAVVDGKIYAIGGHNWGNYFGTNKVYDPATNTWTTKMSMPTPRTNFGIAVVENKIYTIGGETDDWEYTNVNEVYDPAIDTWETKTSMPTIRHAMDANVVDGKIYVIGGSRRGPYEVNFDINEVYDPATDTWTTKTALPTGVQSYTSAVVHNKIYIIGGAVGLSLNQIYDPQTDTWSNGAPLPTGVDGAAAGVTAGDTATQRIYVIGGKQKQNLEVVNLNQVYDPEADTWVAGTAMPTARFSLGVAVVDDSLYAIGGHEGWYGFPISAANERYTPADFIPEFPSWTPLLIMLVAVVAVIVVYRYNLKKQDRRRFSVI